jgi:glycosyltransferase involved in cell wall biosynthesis
MLYVFAAALVLHVAYWLAIAVGLGRVRKEPPELETDIPISVIVAARDEEEHLPTLLAALAAQTHACFEAVIVDDGSADRTAEIVEACASGDTRFRLVRVTEPRDPRKKHALMAGIAAAMHDRLAFTDADCVPPETWLESLAAHAAPDALAVLVGYGPYRQAPGALNAFVRYETWLTAILTAAATGLGRPFMAVGRNFSYPKSMFDRIGGFEHQMHSLSGDDDLLVQEARHRGAPVLYVLDPASYVYTEAPAGWKEWARQKMRHTSAGRHYDRGAQAHLLAFHGSNVAVWAAPLVLGWAGGALLAIRFLVQRAILRRAGDDFAVDGGLLVYQPLLDLAYLVYNALLAPAGVLMGGKRW